MDATDDVAAAPPAACEIELIAQEDKEDMEPVVLRRPPVATIEPPLRDSAPSFNAEKL